MNTLLAEISLDPSALGQHRQRERRQHPLDVIDAVHGVLPVQPARVSHTILALF
jgi:hypothetical protein